MWPIAKKPLINKATNRPWVRGVLDKSNFKNGIILFIIVCKHDKCYTVCTMLTKSEAKKEYWASKSQEERSGQGRLAALARHSKMSKEDKEELINNLKQAKHMAKGNMSQRKEVKKPKKDGKKY